MHLGGLGLWYGVLEDTENPLCTTSRGFHIAWAHVGLFKVDERET